MKKITMKFKGDFTVSNFPPLDGLYVDNERERAGLIVCATAPELLEALQRLFKQCAMVHKHWGDGSNQKESDSAIAAALAAIAKATG